MNKTIRNKNMSDKNVKDRAINSLLILAAERAFQDVTFEMIIGHAELDKLEAREYFDGKSDILNAYGRRIDRQMVENCGVDSSSSHREQLFDLMMERFDIANENRDAVLSILHSFKREPTNGLHSLPHLSRSMARVLECAGIESKGVVGRAKVTAISGVYLYALKSWMRDETADLSKTMAALDKALDRAEMVYNSLPFDKATSFMKGCSER